MYICLYIEYDYQVANLGIDFKFYHKVRSLYNWKNIIIDRILLLIK